MILFHGTTETNWKKIKKDGWLGKRRKKLYLTPHKKIAKMHGDVVLIINYNPKANELKIEHLIDTTPIIQIVTENRIHRLFVKRLNEMENKK